MKEPRGYLNRIFSNFGYKLLALAIACVVWYVVQGEEILEINRRLDVTFEVPQGLAMRESRSISRDATLRGPRVALSDFSDKPIQAVIRLPNGKKGPQRYRLDKDMIPHWDNRIKITVHDPYVNIFTDDRASRSIPVKVSMLGLPKPGVMIHDVKAEPAEVTVTGLKSDIQKLPEISTEVVDVGGLGESKAFPVPLSLSGLPDFDLSTQQVIVHVTVGHGNIEKIFPTLPVEVVGSDKLSSAQPHHVSVTLQGHADLLNRISTKDLQATVDAKDFAPGRYEREVSIRVPQGTSLVSVMPKHVVVEIYNQKKLR